MNEIRKVTLTELLDSREKRVSHQKELLAEYGGVLVSVTLNIPGPVKDKHTYRKALRYGMEVLTEKLSDGEKIFDDEKNSKEQPAASGRSAAVILYREVRELVTGPEGYLIVQETEGLTAEAVKHLTVEIEDSSALGRLFDMDVITEAGGISRADLGAGRRKCLLCSEDAKICARSMRHKTEDLLGEIDRILKEAGF